MAFNKTKVLEAAQKFLNQGKVPQAILEYQKILRVEPKDQVALMTIGDLYVRTGDTTQALDYFEQLAKIFISDGFISKGIAIYKKIAKLAPDSITPMERLSELYVQQGVMSEARPIYLQLAEAHMKGGRSEQAAQTMRKLLDLEPDNLRVQVRLAELYQAIGQPAEAAKTFLLSATRLFEKGDAKEARKMVDRAITLDKKNTRAIVMKARLLAVENANEEAIKLLEGLSELTGESAKLLCDLYLKAGRYDDALECARKIFAANPAQVAAPVLVAMGLFEAGQSDKAFRLVGELREPLMESGDRDRLAQVLQAAVEHMPGRVEPLEWLVEHFRRTEDSFHLPEAIDQLAEASTASGNLERAKELFEELLEREPESESNRRRLNQVLTKLGLEPTTVEETLSVTETPAESGASPVAPPGLQSADVELDEETKRFIAQSLTDVDLFSSYGLTQKAIDLLETVLRRAPRHTPTIEKLLDLYLGAGNDIRTAELAGRLEQIYREQGNTSDAERFAELRRRFLRVAGVAETPAAAPPVAEFAIPGSEAPAAAAEPAAAAQAEPEAEEVDLSAEWAAMALDPGSGSAGAAEEPAPAAAAEPEAQAIEYELATAAPAEPKSGGDKFLDDLASEVDDLQLAPAGASAAAETPAAAGKPVSKQEANQLTEVFEEFRAELGEMGEQAEDLETHYNLGIAYREMGLLEEAIGEFQKVAKEIQAGRPFRYAMQCCTLLGLSFMEKSEPKIAAMWYLRALETPGLDQESILALRYDLGVSQETAGDRKAAMDCYQQVYAMNIDYRDVAERIANLQQAK